MRIEADIRPAPGFTLIEVVVALTVVSLGIIAAFNLIVQISSGSLQMKDRTLASWIASNEIARLRLSGEFPDVSQFDGDVEFAGGNYRWRATISETGVEKLRRIDLDVAYADDPDRVVGRSVGFISPQPTARLGGVAWAGPAAGSDQQDTDARADGGTGESSQEGADSSDQGDGG